MPIVKHLLADTFGSHIGKYSEQLKITHKGETLAQAPLIHLESVSILNRGVSVSADALSSCCERGIPVFFLDSQGTPYASIYAAGLSGTVITRREQLRAFDDKRGVTLGVAFAAGKIRNQAATLKYMGKNHRDTPVGEALMQAATDVLEHEIWLERLQGSTVDAVREGLMAAEGNAARTYWAAVRVVIPQEYNWTSREGRGANDPINCLLNYGYGILYSQVERALVLAGLDPYAGFVHVDRPGKPSLVLDLIEEFRQIAVDRVVFGLANRRFTVEQMENGKLTDSTRQTFARHVLEHLDSGVRFDGERHTLRHVIQTQARRVAAFLRGDQEQYLPFRAGW